MLTAPSVQIKLYILALPAFFVYIILRTEFTTPAMALNFVIPNWIRVPVSLFMTVGTTALSASITYLIPPLFHPGPESNGKIKSATYALIAFTIVINAFLWICAITLWICFINCLLQGGYTSRGSNVWWVYPRVKRSAAEAQRDMKCSEIVSVPVQFVPRKEGEVLV